MRMPSALALFLPLILVHAAGHAQIFICKDAAGHTISSDRLNPECAGSVRELDRGGIVRREMAPPLSAEQKRQLQEKEDKRRAEQAAALERQRSDRTIRLRYHSERDIDVARQRALQPVQELLGHDQAALAAGEAQLSRTRSEAESRKKTTGALPPALQRKLAESEQEVAVSQKAAQDDEAEIGRINANFDRTPKRYRELAASSATK